MLSSETTAAKPAEPFVSAPQRLVRRNQLIRNQLLTQMYYEAQADVSLEFVPASIYEIGNDLDMTPQETESAIFYACAKGYLSMTSSAQNPGEKVQISPLHLTAQGVDYIEALFPLKDSVAVSSSPAR